MSVVYIIVTDYGAHKSHDLRLVSNCASKTYLHRFNLKQMTLLQVCKRSLLTL